MDSIKRVISTVLCAVILFLSPLSVYFSTENISYVYATGAEIPVVVGAGELVLEWLTALSGSLFVEELVRNHPDEVMSGLRNFIYSDDITMEANKSIMVFTSQAAIAAGEAISSFTWEDLLSDISLPEYSNPALSDLKDIYMKACPELLDILKDFVSSIIDGETYIEGVSDALAEQAFTGTDYEAQWAGEYNYKSCITLSYTYTDGYTHASTNTMYKYYHDYVKSVPCAVVREDTVVNNCPKVFYSFYRANGSGYESNNCFGTYERWLDGVYSSGTFSAGQAIVAGGISSYTNVFSSYSGNIPLFSSSEDAISYLKGELDYTNALNFARSMYDTITDNNDLPFWDVEALWERVARAVDVIDSIGAYGQGVAVGTNDWADDLPWVDVGALSEWDDVIDRTLEGILSGVIDLPLDIPDNPTYVDVWQDVIDKTWDDVITDNPAKTDDPSIPLNPDKPIEDNPALDTSIEDTITQTQPFFGGLSGELKNKFPFSIPWDLIAVFTLFQAEPEAPRIEVPFVIESLGIEESIVIDLGGYGLLSRISRSLMVILFVLALIKMTPSMLVFGKDL